MPPKRVAVFDFDHTLIKGDSFMPYLGFVAGRARAYATLVKGVAAFAAARLSGRTGDSARTFLKSYLLKNLIAGRSREDLARAATQIRAWKKEKADVMRGLHEHRDRGDLIVIASGGLDLYLPEMLRDIPHDALICTAIGMENGVATGAMTNGNCVRKRKAELVSAWLKAHGPFDDSWGYGNYPHDLPMMELVTHRIIVS